MDYIEFLKGVGFRSADRSGQRIIERDDCVYIYVWDITQYSLWYTAFIADCLFIKLGYFVLCQPKEVKVLEAIVEAQPNMAPYYGPQLAALRQQKVVTYSDQVNIKTCSFSDPGEVKYADLQNQFNQQLGLQLPAPPAAPAPR